MSRVAKNSKDSSVSVSVSVSGSTSNAWKVDKEQSTHISANDSHSHPSTATANNSANNGDRSTSADRSNNHNTNSIAGDKMQLTSPDAWVKEFAKLAAQSTLSSASSSLSNCQPWLYEAYRFNVSCPHGTHFPQHFTHNQLDKNDSNTKSKIHNCASFPLCLAGLQTLRTSPEALHACACALVGPIPAMYEIPYSEENEIITHSEHKTSSTNNYNNESSEIIREGSNNRKLSEAHVSQPSVCLWRGLRNLSNTCYLNSVLQLLFGVAPVRRAILYDALMNEQVCKKNLHNQLNTSSSSSSSFHHSSDHQNESNANATVSDINTSTDKSNASFATSNCNVNNVDEHINNSIKVKDKESHHHHHRHTTSSSSSSSKQELPPHEVLLQHISPLQESGLPEIFAEMAYSLMGAGADPAILAQYLSLDVTIQQDAQEFLLLLLDWLRTHCSSQVSTMLDCTFCGTLLYDRQCDACGRCSTRAEVLCPLSLPVAPTLEECLEQFLQPEKVDGFNCEGCKSTSTSATSRQYLRRLPPVLLIHLNHFVFDEKDMQRRKIGTSVVFPQLLDLTSYMQRWHDDQKRYKAAQALQREREQKTSKQHSHKEEKELESSKCVSVNDVDSSDAAFGLSTAATQAENNVSYKYELRGILNHLGPTALYGHYTYQEKVPIRILQKEELRISTESFTSNDKRNAQEGEHVEHKGTHHEFEEQHQEAEEEEDVWLEFNDNEVTEMRSMRSSHVTSKDAYVLVYHRIDNQSTHMNMRNNYDKSSNKEKSERESTKSVNKSTINTFAPASCDEFPHYALHHVRQKNTQLLKRRQEWQDEVNNVFALLQKWATAAECVFVANQSSSEKLLLSPNPVNVIKEKQEKVLANNNNNSTSPTLQKWNQDHENSSNNNKEEIYVVPTFWLKAFGNAFLPPYIATSKFGEEPSHDESMVHEIHNHNTASHEYPLGKSEKEEPSGHIRLSSFVGSVVSNSSLCNNSISNSANKNQSSALNANGTIINTGMIMLADGANKYLLSQPLSLLCNAHHKLLPLSDYKVINANAKRAIVEYMNACHHVLSQIEHMKVTQSMIKPVHIEESYTDSSNDKVHVPCLMEVNSDKATDMLCVSCVRDYACMIEKVTAAIAEDKKMNVKLLESQLGIKPTNKTNCCSSSSSPTSMKTTNDKDTHANEKDANSETKLNEYDSVYVSEKVVEMWEKYIKEIEKWETEMNELLDTRSGVIHFLRREIARHASQSQQSHSLAMLPFVTLVKPLSTLLSATSTSALAGQAMNETKTVSEEILCPHGTLKVESVVKSVPLFMYKYWLKRFAQLVTDAHTFSTNNKSNNNDKNKTDSISCFAEIVKEHTNDEDKLNNSNETEREMEAVQEIIVSHILPLLPANSTKRCELCVRSVVEATANRHHMKLLKMEEARRFPTLWAAGKLTSTSSIANLLAETQLENAEQLLLAKHPNKDYFKRPIKQTYRDALKNWREEQEYKIHRMKNTLEFLTSKAEKNRALYLPITESRGRRRHQRRDNDGRGNAPLPPPDPHTLEGRIYRLQKDLEHLQAELENPPVKVEELFGCLPTAWVADWYAYIVEGKSHHHHHRNNNNNNNNNKEEQESQENENDSDSESDSSDDSSSDDENNTNKKNYTTNDDEKKMTKVNAKEQTNRKDNKSINKKKDDLHVPLIDFDKYICPEHHKCLMEIQWLNPADSFWQGGRMKQAHLLWNLHNNNSRNSLTTVHTLRNEWLYYTPPLLIVPLTEYVEVLKQYGAPDMLTEKVEIIEEYSKSESTKRVGQAQLEQHQKEPSQKETIITKDGGGNKEETSPLVSRKVTYEVNKSHVITLLERNGERDLQPQGCTHCTLHMLEELSHQAAYFTFGTLHLQLHLRKSKKQFYDAESSMSSKNANAAQEVHNNNTSTSELERDNTEKSNQVDQGIHHFTTLARLRNLIAEHIFHFHHYSLPEDKLIIMRSRNKPLKVKNQSLESHKHRVQQEEKESTGDHNNAKINPLDKCTLFELDVHDGDILSVNLTDAIAVSCAEDIFHDNRTVNSNNNNSTSITTNINNNNTSNNLSKSQGKSTKKKKDRSSNSKGDWTDQGKDQNEEEEEEVWQEIPPELLMETDALSHYNNNQQQHIHPSQASYNSSSRNATSTNNSSGSNKHQVTHAYGENTFAETKLHGKKSTSHLPGNAISHHNSSIGHGVNDSSTSHGVSFVPPEPIGVSCPRCTYLNAAGMVVCEMCETPLPRLR